MVFKQDRLRLPPKYLQENIFSLLIKDRAYYASQVIVMPSSEASYVIVITPQ